MSPREESAREYLLSASRVLQAKELHEKALDPFLLQAEFFVSPPVPVTPLWVDLSAHTDHAPSKAVVGVPRTQHLMDLLFPCQLSHHLGRAASPLRLRFLTWKMGVEIIGMLQG